MLKKIMDELKERIEALVSLLPLKPGSTTQNSLNQGTASQQSALSTPSGIKKLTVQLSVESPSYEEFETFISTLESLKRNIVVKSIN